MLSAENIVHHYGTVKVLEGVELDVKRTEIIGIFGKSGSGKSTLIAILSGLMKPTSGKVVIDDIEVYSSFSSILQTRRYMGIVFQLRNLLKELTVAENLQVASLARGYRMNSEKIDELLSEMGISHLAQRYPSELSVGEQQRVAIARALVGNLKVVFADEPTGSVDEDNKKSILRLFHKVREKGIPLLLTSHDSETLKICDRIFELRRGKLKEVSTI
ncbi:hypothetical protein IX53_02910 [Kosmotoga pacifica]|uniref:ABC transporter domain-containing protein n=1 Tax=Kosmotoga pacifica TaxID=1330330 RepID=A0A0G2ZHD7_9BACT|nr:hypothetical protein IX53_02910 [Kosmotoga pacifica]